MNYIIIRLKRYFSVSALMMIICMIVSAAAIFVSIQMMYDYQQRINYGDITNREIQIKITYNENKIFSKSDLIKCLDSMNTDALNKVTMICAEAYDDNENVALTDVYYYDEEKGISNEYLGSYNVVPFYFTYIDGKFLSSDSAKKMFSDYNVLNEEDFLTDEQIENSEHVALVDSTLNYYYKDKDSITLFGEEYKIIGRFKNSRAANTLIPFTAVPDQTEMENMITFYFDEIITMDKYRDITAVFKEDYSDVTDPVPIDSSISNRSFYISIIVSLAVIMLIAAANFRITNENLFAENRKKYTIYRIFGASKMTITKRHILFSFAAALFSVGAGYIIYALLLENILQKYYRYIYTDQNRIFVGIMLVFMIINVIYSFVICQIKMKKFPVGG